MNRYEVWFDNVPQDEAGESLWTAYVSQKAQTEGAFNDSESLGEALKVTYDLLLQHPDSDTQVTIYEIKTEEGEYAMDYVFRNREEIRTALKDYC